MQWIIGIVGWTLCGIFGAGIYYAYFQGEYPHLGMERETLAEGLVFGLIFGPFWVIIGLAWSGFMKHGWRLK